MGCRTGARRCPAVGSAAGASLGALLTLSCLALGAEPPSVTPSNADLPWTEGEASFLQPSLRNPRGCAEPHGAVRGPRWCSRPQAYRLRRAAPGATPSSPPMSSRHSFSSSPFPFAPLFSNLRISCRPNPCR